jgi:hypothetical protein
LQKYKCHTKCHKESQSPFPLSSPSLSLNASFIAPPDAHLLLSRPLTLSLPRSHSLSGPLTFPRRNFSLSHLWRRLLLLCHFPSRCFSSCRPLRQPLFSHSLSDEGALTLSVPLTYPLSLLLPDLIAVPSSTNSLRVKPDSLVKLLYKRFERAPFSPPFCCSHVLRIYNLEI